VNTKKIESEGYRKSLELDTDYYAASFCSNIVYYKNKYQINKSEQVIYVTNVLKIFILQILLLVSVWIYIKETNTSSSAGFMAAMHVDVLITRFVCAWLTHLICHKEVKQALAMFKYVLNHSK